MFAGGILIFLIFDTKHRLWVLEMPSQGGSNMYPQPTRYVLRKNINIFPVKFPIFTTEKNLEMYIVSMVKFS